MKSIDVISKRTGSPKRRQALSRTAYVVVIVFSLLTAIPLLSILIDLVVKGWSHFNIDLFTQSTPSGILNGITGTFMMLLIATFLSIPLGLFTGIFLSEKQDAKLANVVRTLTDILQGVPSIVWGIVVYMLVVKTMHTYSAVAGGVALGFMMIPMIIRSTEEGLRMVPGTLKEAGLALGGSYTKVMFTIVVPSAFGSIFTGILLAISRVMGETAPLMVTALGATYVHFDLTRPMSAISLLIWEFYSNPILADLVWSSSLLLLLLILGMNLLAKSVAAKWRI
ncbi:phosphate ABC transporter permease PstA [Porphyromonas somerae]|uniref:phosphate ABC transporter permease PstA n=1 Tax=Porphyromonas somerae TaxID=322095 RepID=UPI002A75532E|nr:phosphate ABC transporter permease PstA [Porphyromonas somerae]MDY3120401.1 phosphate ABC transporter permease PstA [Porphyromonas somerae]MDY3884242.1 phosphate ABC transporter permease PstA [Porphyromonas somerae]